MILSLGMSATAASWTEETFKDWANVGADYKDAVQRLAVHDQGLNVFQGDDNSNFNPQATFTRAELLAVVAIVDNGGNPDKETLNQLFATDAQRGQRFSDVPEAHWAFAAINYAARMGYIVGDGTGKFNPDSVVTSDELYSLCLSLLGFQKEDMDGADWVGKVNSLIRIYGLEFNVAKDYKVTREQVAKVLSKAVDSAKYVKNVTNGNYGKDGDKKLIGNFDADEKDAGVIEITGKVIKTKYASLTEADNFPHDTIAIWNNEGKNSIVYQVDNADDDVVPTSMLGRYIKLKVVATGTSGNHYRPAKGAKAEARYNNDVVGVDMDAKSWENNTKEYTGSNNYWYNWYSLQNNVDYDDTRGAYYGYDSGTFNGNNGGTDATGWNVDNDLLTAANYAYAVRDPDLNLYTEVFFLTYIAAKVDSVTSSKITFTYLNGDELYTQDISSVENGASLAKGDIVVGVRNKDDDGFVTAEKVTAKTGLRYLGRNGVYAEEKWYNRAEDLNGGLIEDDFEETSTTKNFDWYMFSPAYATITGGVANIYDPKSASDTTIDEFNKYITYGAFWTSEGISISYLITQDEPMEYKGYAVVLKSGTNKASGDAAATVTVVTTDDGTITGRAVAELIVAKVGGSTGELAKGFESAIKGSKIGSNIASTALNNKGKAYNTLEAKSNGINTASNTIAGGDAGENNIFAIYEYGLKDNKIYLKELNLLGEGLNVVSVATDTSISVNTVSGKYTVDSADVSAVLWQVKDEYVQNPTAVLKGNSSLYTGNDIVLNYSRSTINFNLTNAATSANGAVSKGAPKITGETLLFLDGKDIVYSINLAP